MFETRDGSFLLGNPRSRSLAFLTIISTLIIFGPQSFISITTTVVSRQDARALLWPWIYIRCLFYSFGFLCLIFGFGLLLLIFIIICQTMSPTTFTKITTSAANRQDAIVYFTVTLAVPLCVPNSHMQRFCWEREKTKYCPNHIHLINPRDLFLWVCNLVGTSKPQVPFVGSKEIQLLHV